MYFIELSICLSLVFGCFVLAFAAQFFYFLWWKKRIITHSVQDIEIDEANYEKGLFYCGFLKTPFSIHATKTSKESETKSNEVVQDLELGDCKEHHILAKSFGEESVELELMRLHNLAGPPRFLFTIKEETNEDLEAEDEENKCRTIKCSIDNSFLTPLSTSSPLKSPFLDPLDYCYNHQGFNPLFESSSLESELYMFRSSSPPPKFKFMKDAEEKLYRKKITEETTRNEVKNDGVGDSPNETLATNKRVRIIENKEGKELQHYLPQFPSTSLSQVHPLESSHTSFRALEIASLAH